MNKVKASGGDMQFSKNFPSQARENSGRISFDCDEAFDSRKYAKGM